MATTIRIKRRASGAAGAPAALKSAEMAHNEIDNTLYIGKGDDGSGNATSIAVIGGAGAFMTLTGPQNVSGLKTFSAVPQATSDALAANELVRKSQFDTALAGKANATHAHAIADVTGLQAALNGKQPLDATLTSLSDWTGTVSSSKYLLSTVGGGTVTGVLVTPFAETLLDDADASTALATLGAAPLASPGFTGTPTAPTAANGTNTAQIATTAFVRATRLDQLALPTADVPMSSRKITGLADPASAQDAATKNYVDLAVQGLDPKASVVAATTGNIATLSGTMTIDGIALVAGDRVLVKDQTTTAQNGIYVVAAGAWSRASDADTWAKIVSAYLFVEKGTVNADNGFICTVDPGGTLGTTAATFVQFSGAGQIVAGAGLTKTGNQIDVATASSARILVNADSIDLATTGVGAGTYKSVTTDVYGRITGGSNPTTLAGFGITDAQPKDATLTSLSTWTGTVTSAKFVFWTSGGGTVTGALASTFMLGALAAADAAAARTTFGLGSMAPQAANNVAITGGTIDGVIFDGGTF